MADHLNGGGNGDPAAGANPSGTGFQGAVTLTLEQIRTELGLLNDQITENYPDATPDELTAYQQQAYAEFIEMAQAEKILQAADCTKEEAEAIFRLTALCTFDERFVIPPANREEAIEMMRDPLEHKQSVGFGFLSGPRRGL